MKTNSKIKLCYYIISLTLLYASTLFSGDSFVMLPNGEQKVLTDSEPACYYTTENGEVTSVKSINLEEEVDIIVAFKGKPLCLQNKSIRVAKSMEMQSEHDAFKGELNKLSRAFHKKIKKSASSSQDYVIKREYFQSFNGLAMRCKRGLMLMIRELPMVDKVYMDGEVKIHLDTSVPQIRADKVREELGLDGSGILVGIVDTGIDYMHPALGQGYGPGYRVIGGYDFINEDSDPVDDHSHGTHVAGIVGANSNSLTGVAPGVSFLAVKVLDENGSGEFSSVLAGIEFCLDPDGNPGTDDAVDIMNMSFGGRPLVDDPVEIAVNNASDAGVLSVVAAGNSGGDNPFDSPYGTIGSPATAEKALTVGACDSVFKLADFSSKGPDPIHFRIKPELVAPGVMIESSVPNGGTESHSGTSMAAPHVAGVAALVKQLYPDWTPEQLKWAMVNSAIPLSGETYNAFEQGTGCVDAWNATQQEIIIQPGILSFGLVDLELDVWRDTLSFTIRNLGEESKDLSFIRDDNLPSGITLSLNPSTVTLAPGEEREITAEIAVSSSVPIINREPFAYFGNVLCTSGEDTTHIPFGFTKANILVVECDIAPFDILIWDPNSITSRSVEGVEGKTKYYIKHQPGIYNILIHFFCINQTEDTMTYSFYYIEKQDVEVGGLTYLTVSHEDAEFYAFQGPVYDINDNPQTEEDLIGNSFSLSMSKSERTLEGETHVGHGWLSFGDVYISKVDTNFSITKLELWGTEKNLLALLSERNGIDTVEDLIPPSGSENLTSLNVKFGESIDNLIGPALSEVSERQRIVCHDYEFTNGSKTVTYLGVGFNKTDYSHIALSKMSAAFNINSFSAYSIYLKRKNRTFILGDIRTDENGNINIFERPAFRSPDHESDLLIPRCQMESADTLYFIPGEEFYLPAIENIWGPGDNLLDCFGRYGGESFVSPIGAYEQEESRSRTGQSVFEYYYYDHTRAIDMRSMFPFGHNCGASEAYTVYRIGGHTQNYCLLGQNGHTTVDYEFDFIENIPYNGYADPPCLDQLILLVDGKPARWLRPGQDNQVRFLIYDANHDVNEIQAYLIPSSGQKIELNLEINAEKREVFADIPDSLPHEFMDLQVVVSDSSDNRTSVTAAPAFFYGNALDERVYDSRVYLVKYNLENGDQFPFSAGDNLSLSLNLISNGNLAADSIMVVYPTTSEFMPIHADTVYVNPLDPGAKKTVSLDLKVLIDHTEEHHLVYTPEIHWKSNGKSYMREYPVLIKTWESGTSAVGSETETATPLSYKLHNNYPNPFNLSTTIHFQIPVEEHVKIAIYNILGQHVRTLIDKSYQRGDHQITWDGTNEAGKTVESGVYFCRIEAGDFNQSQKMVLLK